MFHRRRLMPLIFQHYVRRRRAAIVVAAGAAPALRRALQSAMFSKRALRAARRRYAPERRAVRDVTAHASEMRRSLFHDRCCRDERCTIRYARRVPIRARSAPPLSIMKDIIEESARSATYRDAAAGSMSAFRPLSRRRCRLQTPCCFIFHRRRRRHAIIFA
jgi:hypothetical protein